MGQNKTLLQFVKVRSASCQFETVRKMKMMNEIPQGVIDFEKEIVKMEKSRKGIENKISSQEKKMSAKDYASKVPEAVQSADKENIGN